MSVEVDAWTAFRSQITGDSSLSSIVTTFKTGYKEEQFTPSDFPIVVLNLTGITDEERIGVPKEKIVQLSVTINGKIYNPDQAIQITDALNLDEKIKNAIEKDLQLSGNSTNIFIGDTEFLQIDNDIRDLKFEVKIMTNRFTMGLR